MDLVTQNPQLAGSPGRSLVGALPLTRIGSVLFFLLSWQAVSALGVFPDYLFPGPVHVAARLWEVLANGQLARAAGLSLVRLFAGYLLSLLVGLPLGIALGRSRLVRETLGTFVLGRQALPSICWLPLALLWFGLTETAILAVVVLGAALAVALAAESATRNVPPVLVRAARTMGLSGVELQLRVVLPAALPELLGGARLGWTFAWRSLMAAELLFFNGGLGQMLTIGRDLNDLPLVMAVMAVIVALGLIVERLIFNPARSALSVRWGTHRA
jgi:NitT/TauT family transport system permease protein